MLSSATVSPSTTVHVLFVPQRPNQYITAVPTAPTPIIKPRPTSIIGMVDGPGAASFPDLRFHAERITGTVGNPTPALNAVAAPSIAASPAPRRSAVSPFPRGHWLRARCARERSHPRYQAKFGGASIPTPIDTSLGGNKGPSTTKEPKGSIRRQSSSISLPRVCPWQRERISNGRSGSARENRNPRWVRAIWFAKASSNKCPACVSHASCPA